MEQARTNNGGAAAQAVLERLSHLTLGEGLTHERMVLYPIFSANGARSQPPLNYRILEQAIADSTVTVTEKPSASVPELLIHNQSPLLILILDGEEIVGGRQNRVVNTSFLVGAQTEMVLPVTCVEHGRWHDTSATFSSGETAYHKLRAAKHYQVTESLRSSGRPTANQSEVWEEVAERTITSGSRSTTGAMHEIYRTRSHDLGAYQAAFPYAAGAVGMLVALHGRVVGADLFDQPPTAQTLWPKLLRSYALDALEEGTGERVSQEQAMQFLKYAQGARYEVFPSVALGEEVRLEGDGVFGGGLVYQETPVHISLFRAQDEHLRRSARARAAQQQRTGLPEQRREEP